MTRLIVSFLVVGLGDALQILFDSTNHFHRDLTRRTHPEQPARVTACLRALDRLPVELIDIADVPNAIDGLTVDRYQPFDKQQLDHARDMMRATHRPDLVDALEDYCTLVKQERVQDGLPPLAHLDYIDRDTYLTTETFSVCHRAAAAWIHAVDQCRSSKVAMALTRPPGHHATEDTQNGFCFFNFAAIAAVHALQDPTVSKVSILDFDVHYGQGIAEQVEKYERARFCSIHQVPAFPYMGETRGRQGVYENVLNLPIQADTTWDTGFSQAFQEALEFLCSDEWDPDVVIVAAGFDALESDVLASVRLQATDYRKMAVAVWEHLKQHSKKPPAVMVGLEGGYQLLENVSGGNLQTAVVELMQGFLETTQTWEQPCLELQEEAKS